ncbi:MAG: hypothetical protein GWN13_27530 [Phycisphaerae bacterium]|nr:hypothetical protein [Phycisphaerae bacterium]NIX01921.1 hypothetical protein [Phycisphaerae bacterium]
MKTTNRTEQEIRRLINALETEIGAMPETDLFGDSTSRRKDEYVVYVNELKGVLEGKPVLNQRSEVYWWLADKENFLTTVYGV